VRTIGQDRESLKIDYDDDRERWRVWLAHL